MNLAAFQIYGMRDDEPVPTYTLNTFIGGMGATINTPALLAARLGILENRIVLFSVVNNNIQCAIIGTGKFQVSFNEEFATYNITYYYDNDGYINNLDTGCFKAGKRDFEGYFPGIINQIGASICQDRNTGIILRLPNCISIPNFFIGAYYSNLAVNKILILPRCTNLGSTKGNDAVFRPNSQGFFNKAYFPVSEQTSNAGGVEGDIAQLITNGSTVIYVTNFTAPSAITTLAAGTIYSTAVQLNFTPPSSTNAIEYYECYANGVLKNKITASGQYITGLTASTSYNITLVAVDIFYNKSLVSNTVVQSTNTTSPAQPTTGLISYYKLEANSNDSYGSNNGVDASVSYVAGKIGNTASYNGTNSKTTVGNPTNLQISTGTISCWIKTSGAGSSYRFIFGKPSAYGVFLFDGVLVVYNWSTYGTTGNKSTGINLNDNLWHHIAFVFESNTALNYLYLDGVLKLTFSWAVLNQTINFEIANSSSVQNFNGLIDEASVYNTKLTQNQIELIYNGGNGITL